MFVANELECDAVYLVDVQPHLPGQTELPVAGNLKSVIC